MLNQTMWLVLSQFSQVSLPSAVYYLCVVKLNQDYMSLSPQEEKTPMSFHGVLFFLFAWKKIPEKKQFKEACLGVEFKGNNPSWRRRHGSRGRRQFVSLYMPSGSRESDKG